MESIEFIKEYGEDYFQFGTYKPCKETINYVIDKNDNPGRGPWIRSDGSLPGKFRKCVTHKCSDQNWILFSGGQGRLDLTLDIKSQDADYSNLPQLGDELEAILARIPILEFRKICLLSKRFLALIKNGELLKIRRMISVKEASVFMFATGEENWWAFDHQFTSHRALPVLPSDDVCFKLGDRESLCAGTHLLVCGSEVDGPVIWLYELMMNKWYKGPLMMEPRCLFASASCGDYAFVAGGIDLESNTILDSAERYDPNTKSWEPLPKMEEKRKMCSGVYMDKKFYVIGGQNEQGDALTCAEVYDEDRKTWVKIEGMLHGLPLATSHSPPLLAVVNNELYTIETSSNRLMVYLKDSISWKELGPIPVRADINRGWGVAFKSLGNELLVIGGSTLSFSGRGMTIYTCYPNPNAEGLNWKLRKDGGDRSNFIMNCTVMLA